MLMFSITLAVFAVLIAPVRIGSFENNREYLNKDNMNKIKGIACIMVVICHVTSQLEGEGILALTANLGYLAVGLFFFWSGYGLMYSLSNKQNYLSGFIVRRFIPVLLPFWVTNILFLIRNTIFFHQNPDAGTIFRSIIGLELINKQAWYVQVILVVYILFFICCKVLKEKKKVIYAMTLLVLISNLAFIITSQYALGQSLLFVIGMWTAFYSENKMFRHKLATVLMFVLTALTYLYYTVIRWHVPIGDIRLLNNLVMTVSQCGFTLCCMILWRKIKINSKISEYIGHISYEVYLVQQLCIDACIFAFAGKSHTLTLVSSILLTVLAGWIIHKLLNPLVKRIIFVYTGGGKI